MPLLGVRRRRQGWAAPDLRPTLQQEKRRADTHSARQLIPPEWLSFMVSVWAIALPTTEPVEGGAAAPQVQNRLENCLRIRPVVRSAPRRTATCLLRRVVAQSGPARARQTRRHPHPMTLAVAGDRGRCWIDRRTTYCPIQRATVLARRTRKSERPHYELVRGTPHVGQGYRETVLRIPLREFQDPGDDRNDDNESDHLANSQRSHEEILKWH